MLPLVLWPQEHLLLLCVLGTHSLLSVQLRSAIRFGSENLPPGTWTPSSIWLYSLKVFSAAVKTTVPYSVLLQTLTFLPLLTVFKIHS